MPSTQTAALAVLLATMTPIQRAALLDVLGSALDALDADDLRSTITIAIDEIACAESVETMVNFEACLMVAEGALADALKLVRRLRARSIDTLAMGAK